MPWNEHQAVFLQELGVRWVRGQAAAPPVELRAGGAESALQPVNAPAGLAAPRTTEAPVVQTLVSSPDASGVNTDLSHLDWQGLRQAVSGCQACGLCQSRKQTVFGVGSTQAHWMIVGEAPGEQEDLKGEPFVGAAGRLLDQMLRALQLTRSTPAPDEPLTPERRVYIANSLKCRPPGNRNPQPDELQQCEPFLQRQLALLKPRIILAMGRFAVQSLLRSNEPIGKLRSRVHVYRDVPLVVTYHPAYLLRNPLDKAKAWADLCLAADTFERSAALPSANERAG